MRSHVVDSRLRAAMGFLLVLAAGLGLPGLGRAAVVRVPGDYPSFRQGLAAVGPGDTLLLGTGNFNEPGGPAYIQPGVTVIGSGWDPASFLGTTLSQIQLVFPAGSLPAVVEDLRIGDRHVSSANSHATVRRCMFGRFDGYWNDGGVADITRGLTIE